MINAQSIRKDIERNGGIVLAFTLRDSESEELRRERNIFPFNFNGFLL